MQNKNERDFFAKKGYKEYPRTKFDHPGIQACFQKCFSDDIGKRYFIDIHEWSPIRHPYTGDVIGPSYEFEIYFYKGEGDDRLPIKMLFYAGWTLDEVEQHANELFNTGLYSYYSYYQ